jgi:hypothetical protein
MRQIGRIVLGLAAASLLVSPRTGNAQQTPPPAAATATHRVELKPAQGKALPYTIEVPADWTIRQVPQAPGLWLGPADATPPGDPRLIWVRGSSVSLADPATVVENIKLNDKAQPGWSAPLVEVREVGGVKGVLVRMDTGEGDAGRSTLTLKLPLDKTAVDFLCQADRKSFEKNLAQCERVLLSVRPVPAATPAKP